MTATEVTPEGFRRMREDFVFIAGSSDVLEVRHLAMDTINRTLRDTGKTGEIDVFSEVVDTGPEGLDQKRAMQKNLPRPSDPRCRGIFAFIGERIGLPLGDEFDLDLIADVQGWVEPGHRFKLCHPWPDDSSERMKRLSEGCYPLTGTVFEILDALGTKNKPIYLGLLADEPISIDGEDISLNGAQYLNKSTRGMNLQQRRAWEDNEYAQQTQAVHNFFRALAKAGREQNPSRDPERISKAVSAFMGEEVLGKRIGRRNPYKYLNFYDIEDGVDFFGRNRTVERAVAELSRRFDRRESQGLDAPPATLRLVGPSGCGKSSTLRAGILRSLLEPEHRQRYAVVAVHPEDFRNDAGEMMPIVPTMMDLIAESTHLQISRRESNRVQRAGANAPSLAVQILEESLAREDTEVVKRLVIGADQFEEILDMVSGRSGSDDWQPLIAFINAASRTSRIAIAYTLEESRRKTHDDENLGPAFSQALEHPLDDLSDDFLHEVIDKPFRQDGYPLSEEAIEKLKSNLNALRPDDEPTARNTILPLLALKLSHLIEEVSDLYDPILSTHSLAFEGRHSRTAFGIPAEGLDLTFKGLIKQQAEIAWRRAGAKLPMKVEDLDHFLQPFVGVSSDKIQLRVAERERPYRDERRLVKSFIGARLMVPVGHAGARIVHEAMLRHWPDAWRWYEERRSYLKMKAQLDAEAEAWSLRGRPDVTDMATDSVIDAAAQVLKTYKRAWSFRDSALVEADGRLRDYCLALFQQSEAPDKLIQAIGGQSGNHANLAASYGLISLLEKFQDLDSECLNCPNILNMSKRPLHHAAWAQETAVTYLLDQGVDPMAQDADGFPAVNAAIQVDEIGIFHRILNKARQSNKGGRFKNLKYKDGATLLHTCAAFDRLHMARILIEVDGLSPMSVTNAGWLPIHYAAWFNSVETFKFFRSTGNDLAQTKHGSTCLHLAAYNGADAVVDLILRGVRPSELLGISDILGRNALHTAALGHHPECVMALLPSLDPNAADKNQDRPIHCAIKSVVLGGPAGAAIAIASYEGDVYGTLEALMADPRLDPNLPDGSGRTALALAERMPKVQKLLLGDPRLDLASPIERDGEPAYALAARLGYWGPFHRFLEESDPPVEFDLDGRGNSFLHLLAHKRSPLEVLTKHLDTFDTAILNNSNKAGQTPIRLAIAQKHWKFIDHLLDLDKVKLTRSEADVFGIIKLAMNANCPEEIIVKMRERNSDIFSEIDALGWTPLHYACAHQSVWGNNFISSAKRYPALWATRDRQGRRPVDLRRPEDRDGLPGADEALDWPASKSWDSDLSWVSLEGEGSAGWIDQLSDVTKDHSLGDKTRVQTSKVDFYPKGVTLARATDETWSNESLELYFLKRPDKLVQLNGTSPEIHAANASTVDDRPLLRLTPETALEYLRFYCFFVRGEDGPFIILESGDQREVPGDLSEADRATLIRFAHPAWYNGEGEECFYASALVYYSNALYGAEFKIYQNGMIEMLDDIPLTADLTAKVDRPIV